jgi:hypothetical protein
VLDSLPAVRNERIFEGRRVATWVNPRFLQVLTQSAPHRGIGHRSKCVPGEDIRVGLRLLYFTCSVVSLQFYRDRMTVRGAPVVRRLLKPTWSPSISQSKGRNLLSSFSQVLTQARARDHDACRSRVLATSNFPLLRRHCSLHHSPLDVSASLMASSSENVSDHYRLPTNARPRHYDLTIRTDLENEKFTGFVKIECVHVFLVS